MTVDRDDETPDNTSVDTNALTPISCILCKKDSCKRLCCKFNNYWKLLAMFFAVFFYVVVGGAIFAAVERPAELRSIEEAQETRRAQTEALVALLVNSTNMTEEEATNLTVTVIEISRLASVVVPAESNPIWDFSSAIFFATTVITTIGYGSIAPSTNAGQIIFMFYAIIGIPMALIFLSQIGVIIDHWVERALRPVERRWGASLSRFIGAIFLLTITLVFFILIPGAIYNYIEGWTYTESVYYTVVTLSTVGFGDFVPGQAVEGIGGVNGLYKMISSVWLWMGLALVSALLTEMQHLLTSLGELCHDFNKKHLFKRFVLEKQELGGMNGKGSDTVHASPPPQDDDINSDKC